MLEVTAIRAFSDNYIWCIHDTESRQAIVVDPGSAQEVEVFLKENNLKLSAILITHHHQDHIGGVKSLIHHRTLDVYGFSLSDIRVINHPVSHGDSFTLLGCTFKTLEVPGHTLDHIAYFSSGKSIKQNTQHLNPWLFCGDTLFSGGCGRLFEGSPSQMHKSLSQLAELPVETEIYCAHEYTLSNLAFALTLMPSNTDLQTYIDKCKALRHFDTPTLPTTIEVEQKINPFLRVGDKELISVLVQQNPSLTLTPESIFAAIRKAKDYF